MWNGTDRHGIGIILFFERKGAKLKYETAKQWRNCIANGDQKVIKRWKHYFNEHLKDNVTANVRDMVIISGTHAENDRIPSQTFRKFRRKLVS